MMSALGEESSVRVPKKQKKKGRLSELKVALCACVLTKFKLRDFTSCLCSAAAWAVCFEGSVAGVNVTATGNEVSQLMRIRGGEGSKNPKPLWTSYVDAI